MVYVILRASQLSMAPLLRTHCWSLRMVLQSIMWLVQRSQTIILRMRSTQWSSPPTILFRPFLVFPIVARFGTQRQTWLVILSMPPSLVELNSASTCPLSHQNQQDLAMMPGAKMRRTTDLLLSISRQAKTLFSIVAIDTALGALSSARY